MAGTDCKVKSEREGGGGGGVSGGHLFYLTGVALTRKKCVFYAKKSTLRKSENAVRLLYAKNSDLTHQNGFSLFGFLHPADKVCRALAVGLKHLRFPPPPPPSLPHRIPVKGCWCLRYNDTHRH